VRFNEPRETEKYYCCKVWHHVLSGGAMKYLSRSVLFFLIMVAFYFDSSTAQTSLNGFLNIPFGAKMETAKKLLLQKPGVKFIRQGECNNLYFTGFSMGAFKVDTCILMESLANGRFALSNLVFHPKAGLLKEIYELFRGQYGSPTKIYSENNDTFYTWEFPVKGSKRKNSITLQNISTADYFLLSYSGMGMLRPGWL
jgi:hypothetical protein